MHIIEHEDERDGAAAHGPSQGRSDSGRVLVGGGASGNEAIAVEIGHGACGLWQDVARRGIGGTR